MLTVAEHYKLALRIIAFQSFPSRIFFQGTCTGHLPKGLEIWPMARLPGCVPLEQCLPRDSPFINLAEVILWYGGLVLIHGVLSQLPLADSNSALLGSVLATGLNVCGDQLLSFPRAW